MELLIKARPLSITLSLSFSLSLFNKQDSRERASTHTHCPTLGENLPEILLFDSHLFAKLSSSSTCLGKKICITRREGYAMRIEW